MKRPPSEPIDPTGSFRRSRMKFWLLLATRTSRSLQKNWLPHFLTGDLLSLKNTDHFATPDSFALSLTKYLISSHDFNWASQQMLLWHAENTLCAKVESLDYRLRLSMGLPQSALVIEDAVHQNFRYQRADRAIIHSSCTYAPSADFIGSGVSFTDLAVSLRSPMPCGQDR